MSDFLNIKRFNPPGSFLHCSPKFPVRHAILFPRMKQKDWQGTKDFMQATWLFVLLFFMTGFPGQLAAQNCTAGTPSFFLDLSSDPNSLRNFTDIEPKGQCCDADKNQNCMEFVILLHPEATAVRFNFTTPTGSLFYQVNCNTPVEISSNSILLCFSDPGPHTITFCRSGKPKYSFSIISSKLENLVSLNPFDPVCLDALPFTLTGGSPANGRYYINGVLSTQFNPAFWGAGDHTITYTYIEPGTNCTASASQTIKVIPPAVITWTPQSFCSYDGQRLLTGASPPGGFYWGNFISANQINTTLAGPGTHTVNYTYVDAQGCSSTSSSTIQIANPPIANAGPDQTIVSGTSTTLNAGVPGPGTYAYFWEPAHLLVNPNVPNPTTVNLTTATLFTLTVVDLATGCSATDQVVINLIGGVLEIADIVSAPPAICFGGSTNLWVLPSGGSGSYTFQWTSNPAGLNSNQQSVTVSPTVTTTYFITITDALFPGNSITGSVEVVVHPLPTVSLEDSYFSCGNTPYSLTGGTPPGGTYTILNTAMEPLNFPYLNFNNFIPSQVGTGLFYIRYEYTDANGCSSQAIAPFEISPPVNAKFFANQEDPCLSHIVTIRDVSTGATRYEWDFGDGTTATTALPEFTKVYNYPSSTTTYTITLTVYNDDNCFSQMTRKVTVDPPLNAFFTSDQIEGCSPLTIAFNNQSDGPILYYFWDFGDGTSSTFDDPVKTFTNFTDQIVVYPVTLTLVSENFLCTSVATQDITVYPYIEAGFTFAPAQGCHPLEIDFFNTAFNGEFVEWHFGDGTVLNSTAPVVSHTFENFTNAPVDYLVKQIAYNTQGCIDSLEQTLTVYPFIEAVFTPSTLEGCAPLTVSFTDASTGVNKYFWDFDDFGSSSETNPVHTFENDTDQSITYTVKLLVESANLCYDSMEVQIVVHPRIIADFSFQPAEACSPSDIVIVNNSYGANTYTLDFGDGSPVVTLNGPWDTYTHTFDHTLGTPQQFEVRLTASNAQLCSSTQTKSILVYPRINAAFTAIPDQGCNPLEVSFENNSTGATKYRWEFGDGGSSPVFEPVHEYKNPSSTNPVDFTVWLFVESEWGCKDSLEQLITVYPELIADFVIDHNAGCSPLEITIQNRSIGATSYNWDFGNGTGTNADAEFTRTFVNTGNSPQTFNIVLQVENAQGCREMLTRQITVYPEVEAAFSTQTQGCHPLDITFTNNSRNGVVFSWDFGDGHTSTATSPVHRFNNISHTQTATYLVKLLATSPFGCVDSIIQNITVFPQPKVAFEVLNSPGCSPYEIMIRNQSEGIDIYAWNFGDGSLVSNESGPTVSHTYNLAPGSGPATYTITLTGRNNHGCEQVYTQQVIIYPNITAAFTPNVLQGCHPLEVRFTNTSQGATAHNPYFWNYGDGHNSTNKDLNHTHIFNNFSHTRDTVYTVTLYTYNENGCMDSTRVDITVFPAPRPFFSIPNAPGCAPHEVIVHNFSSGVNNYQWTMGEGTTYYHSGDHFTHTYTQAPGAGPGTFTITLEARNNQGCIRTYDQQVVIFPEIHADFSMPDDGCHPYATQFTNLSQGADFFHWRFGEGNESRIAQPTHTFFNHSHTDSKTYTVSLNIESHYGCKDAFERTIIVRPQPLARFDTDLMEGCSPFTTPVNNRSIGATQFNWNFSNGISNNDGASFDHTWSNTGTVPVNFPISLQVSNVYGCTHQSGQSVNVFPEVVAEYTAENDIWAGCSPLSVRFFQQSQQAYTHQWDFGEGNKSTSANPVHIFYNHGIENAVYDIKLLSTSLYGCTDSISKQVTVYAQPHAKFAADPTKQVYPATTFTFYNQTNPGLFNFNWTFGDGAAQSTTSYDPLSHTYVWDLSDMSTKTYEVTLRASNAHCSSSHSQQVTITSPIPVAIFHPSTQGCAPLEVQFTNSSLYAHSYRWDFRDGTISVQPEPRTIFFVPGVYDVRMIAIGDGGQDTTYRRITVFENPTVDFSLVTNLVKIPDEPVVLINKTQTASFYEWDFGDGNKSNAFEPTHYYTQPGFYSISLKAWTDTNPQCFDSLRIANAVRVEENCDVLMPNAFKPNPSGPSGGYYNPFEPSTEIFHPLHRGLDNYVLEIYTRWGELIFRSTDINIGWDGYYRGQLAKMDVYVWKLSATCTNGRKIVKSGDVTLYR